MYVIFFNFNKYIHIKQIKNLLWILSIYLLNLRNLNILKFYHFSYYFILPKNFILYIIIIIIIIQYKNLNQIKNFNILYLYLAKFNDVNIYDTSNSCKNHVYKMVLHVIISLYTFNNNLYIQLHLRNIHTNTTT